MKIMGIISVEFDAISQLLIIYSAFIKYLKKMEYKEAMHKLFIDFKEAYDSVRREVLCNILIDFSIPMKLVRLITMCLNQTYSRDQVGKHLRDMFPITNCLKQGDNLSPLLLCSALEYAIRSI